MTLYADAHYRPCLWAYVDYVTDSMSYCFCSQPWTPRSASLTPKLLLTTSMKSNLGYMGVNCVSSYLQAVCPAKQPCLEQRLIDSTASENVEQLYKKSVEPKPIAQESSRSKPAAKPPRKVYPTFDINATIAREFLARARKGKDTMSKNDRFIMKMRDWRLFNFRP